MVVLRLVARAQSLLLRFGSSRLTVSGPLFDGEVRLVRQNPVVFRYMFAGLVSLWIRFCREAIRAT